MFVLVMQVLMSKTQSKLFHVGDNTCMACMTGGGGESGGDAATSAANARLAMWSTKS